MIDYLLSKARKAGLPAWKTVDGSAIVVRFEYRILGKCETKTEVRISDLQQFNAIIGGI